MEFAPSEASTPISLFTSDGIVLSGRHWHSPREDPRGVVVLVHGLAASKDHPQVEQLATRLQRSGFDVVSYDARGHGSSQGIYTLGQLEHLDVAAAASWAMDHGTPTILIGASLGGIAVLRYAVEHSELAGVVIVSSPAEWRIPLRVRAVLTVFLARTRTGRWVAARRMGVRIGPGWISDEPPRALADRVRCPLVVIHGRRDALIPARWGLEFHLRADERRYVVLAHDMGHAFDPKGHDAICAGVEWILAKATGAA